MKYRLCFVLFSVLCVLSLSQLIYADTYDSEVDTGFFSFISMILKEGAYPDIVDAELKSISQATDIKLIQQAQSKPQVTWIGHATTLIQYKGFNVLTDPHFSKHASPVNCCMAERLLAPAVFLQELPKIDFVVISHNHYDHLDIKTVNSLKNSVIWYVPMGLKAWFIDEGVDESKVVELNWWQSIQFSDEVKITFTPTVHWSKRGALDKNDSLWGSWSLNIAGFKVWFGGDTGYNKHMFKQIQQRLGAHHLSLIPIGAYAPRYFMHPQHVDPEHAVKIHRDLASVKSIPIHWGTFQLSHEPLLEPIELLQQEMVKQGLANTDFAPIKLGETLILESILASSL